MSCLGAVLEQRGLQGGGRHLLVDLNSCRPHARNTMLGCQIINADQNSTPLYKKNLFRIRIDTGFFADPDPGYRSLDPDSSINNLMGSK